jgi:nucleoside diphosphate kinase
MSKQTIGVLSEEQEKAALTLMELQKMKKYKAIIEGHDQTQIQNNFINELEKEATKYMLDDLYDERQTQIMINRKLDELQPKYEQQSDKAQQDFSNNVEEMKNYVGALSEAAERVATREFEKERPYLSDLENRLKSELSLTQTGIEITNVLKEYEKRAAKYKVIAHFLMNNMYKFTERLNQVGGDREQFNRLYAAFQSAKAEVYGKEHNAFKVMMNGLEHKGGSANDGTKRLINIHTDAMRTNFREALKRIEHLQQSKTQRDKQGGNVYSAGRMVY